MSDNSRFSQFGFATRAVHAGNAYIAVSLGHDESLIVFLGENDERQYLYPEEFHNGFFRFSVGIEDAADIIADLRQAMRRVGLL